MTAEYDCPVCLKRLMSPPLTDHLSSVHQYTKCADCTGNVFVERLRLAEHMATRHKAVSEENTIVGKRKVSDLPPQSEPSPKKMCHQLLPGVKIFNSRNCVLHKRGAAVYSADNTTTSSKKTDSHKITETRIVKKSEAIRLERKADGIPLDKKDPLEPVDVISGELKAIGQPDSLKPSRNADSGKKITGKADLAKLTRGTYSKPSKYEKDPLVSFWCAAIFECRECPARPPRKFNSLNSWLQHIKLNHLSLTISSYKIKHGNPDITNYKHKCQLCNKTLALKQSTFKKHLRVIHSMDISDYTNKFRKLLLAERSKRPLIPPGHALDGWWEGCMYSCSQCPYTAPGSTSLEHHLTLVHNSSQLVPTNKGTVIDKAGSGLPESRHDLCTLTRFHQCYICNRIVRHEYRPIYHHLLTHKIGLDKYTVSFRQEIMSELEKKGMGYVVEREQEIKNSPTLDEFLKRREVEESEQAASAEERLMKEWADNCEFKCAICQEVVFSNIKFNLHVVRKHKLKNIKEYRTAYGEPESKHRLHKCQLCGCNIKWEATRIRDHLKCSHKLDNEDGRPMTLKIYADRFREQIIAQIRKAASAENNHTGSPPLTSPAADKMPLRLGKSVIGPAGKTFSKEEWHEFNRRRLLPGDRISCPHCKLGLNRSSFNRHMLRSHARLLVDTNTEKRLQTKTDALALVDGEKDTEMAGENGLGDITERLIIDEESGEILLFEDGQENSFQGLSIVICTEEEEEEVQQADEFEQNDDVIIEDLSSLSPESDLPDAALDDDLDSECDLETGPLDGHVMEIYSPLPDMNVNYTIVDEQPVQTEATHAESEAEDPTIASHAMSDSLEVPSSSVEIDEGKPTEIVGTQLNTEVRDGNSKEVVVKEPSICSGDTETINVVNNDAINVPDDTEQVTDTICPEEWKQSGDEQAKDLGQLIISNEAVSGGVQQLIVRVKGGVDGTGLEQSSFLSQISSLLNHDNQKMMDDSKDCLQQPTEDPLRIVEIDLNPANSKSSKVAAAYAKKAISHALQVPGGKCSTGTQASPWTKMAGERSKIARSKLLIARAYVQAVEETTERISSTRELEGYLNGGYQYSSRATQVCHDYSRGLYNEEEDEEMKERIIAYVQAGYSLDRTCPGCNKMLAKPKNLIIHLQSQHGVRLAGSMGEALHAKHLKENEAVNCPVCQMPLSRKSLRRHLRNKHNQK